jgi:hypothetical protein
MAVIAFPDRTDPGSPYEPYRLDVTLRKADHVWRYTIAPWGTTPDYTGRYRCQTWVRFDGRAHRAAFADSLHAVKELHGQYCREMARLEADGWIADEETSR